MKKLNFPSYSPKIKKSDQGEYSIYDPIRKKYIVLTPEEWVRQHVINWLLTDLNLSEINIAVEKQLNLNGTKKRFDLLVYKEAEPILLVELKAPEVHLNQETCYQIARYNSILKVKQLMISNGMESFLFKYDDNRDEFIPINQLEI